jgi:hypothetical protein
MRFTIVAGFVLIVAAAGCAANVPAASACRNLTYTKAGLSRSEYLPCAGEMIAALDDVAVQSNAAFKGEQDARSKGQASLGKAKALFSQAGGRNLLERWDDRGLMDLNVTINNAITGYSAFYMVRIKEEPAPCAAETRSAAQSELQKASRRYDEARAQYSRLR